MLNSLLNTHHFKQAISYIIATSCLTLKQYLKIKSPIIDTNSYLNQILPVFDSLNKELSPGFQLIDSFPNYFSFYTVNCKDAKTRAAY